MAEETKATGSEKESPPAAVNEKGKQPEATAPPAPEDKTQPRKTDPGKTAPAVKSEEKAAAAPAKDKPNHDGPVIDFSEVFKDKATDDRPPWEKTQAELDAEKKKSTRPSKPKAEKAAPAGKAGKAAAKGDKAGKPDKSTEKGAKKAQPPVRDKVSQSKADKAAAEKTPAEAAAPPIIEPKEPPQPIADSKIVYLKISELHPFHTFREHPFKVLDDDRMAELVSSIKKQGVMTPATVRPEKDGSGYEVIAGHRRRHGSELAGLDVLPCIIRNMSDHEAVMEMKNSNKQRGDPLPSELARLLDLEMEDTKHQGVKLAGVAAGDVGKRSAEIVGENNGMNYKKVMRYVRLNSLVPDLLNMVDEKRIGFMPAVELSYIKPKNQRLIAVSIEGEQSSPSVAQAKKLRELDQSGKLTGDIIDGILSEEKKEVERVIITTDELNKYFGKDATPRQMKDQILALLDEWKEKQPPELKAPTKALERG